MEKFLTILEVITGQPQELPLKMAGWWLVIFWDDFYGAWGDRIEECSAVVFSYYSAVENDYNSSVGFVPDQPSEALLEFYDGNG